MKQIREHMVQLNVTGTDESVSRFIENFKKAIYSPTTLECFMGDVAFEDMSLAMKQKYHHPNMTSYEGPFKFRTTNKSPSPQKDIAIENFVNNITIDWNENKIYLHIDNGYIMIDSNNTLHELKSLPTRRANDTIK